MIASILPDIDMSDSVKFGFQVWNTFMKSVYALLTESPSQFKDGEVVCKNFHCRMVIDQYVLYY